MCFLKEKMVINNLYFFKNEYLILRDKINYVLSEELLYIWGYKRLIWEVCRCGSIKLIIFNNYERLKRFLKCELLSI